MYGNRELNKAFDQGLGAVIAASYFDRRSSDVTAFRCSVLVTSGIRMGVLRPGWLCHNRISHVEIAR